MRQLCSALDLKVAKMKHITIACGLCTVMLLSNSAQSAPRHRGTMPRAKPAATRALPVTEVKISEQSATDIRGFGTVTTWTLHPNGTVVREGNHAGRNMGDAGDPFREHGTFEASDFKPLVAYLNSSRLLELKAPQPKEMEGALSVSMVHGGKRRQLVIPDSASTSALSSGRWAALTLVRGITAATDWKNDAGFSVSTGVHVQFLQPDDVLHADFHSNFPRFSVRDAKGKQVAEALVQSEDMGIRQPLPPGSYTIVPEAPDDAKPDAKGLIWRASPEKFQIEPGAFTTITIALEKAPAAP